MVVDQSDRVVRYATRAECHANADMLHRSIHVIVESSEGLLLQRRGFGKDKGAGLWDSACAGHVGPSESYTEAAVRELKEELGIDAIPTFIGTCHIDGDGETELCGVHVLLHDGPFVFGVGELAGLCVYKRDELPSKVTPALRQVLDWLTSQSL